MILNGKELSKNINLRLKQRCDNLNKNDISPSLAIILIGDNPESRKYVELKKKTCLKIGVDFNLREYDKNVTEQEIIEELVKLNNDKSIHGIIVQLPLPKHLDEVNILNKISVDKDVDGFHEINAGKLFLNRGITFSPCTPLGCIELIDHYRIDVEGFDICIIGCSNIVGLPLSMMLLRRNATVTLCHKYTKCLKNKTLNADMIVTCCGFPKILKEDMVKEGVIIIDVGINFVDGILVGDADFDNLKNKAIYITPVPGGVGPMTVSMLLKQTIESAERLIN